MRCPIAITGWAVRTGAGHSATELRDAIDSHRFAWQTAPYSTTGLAERRAVLIEDLPRERPALDLLRQVVLQAASGRDLRGRTGLVVGTSSGDISGPWERWLARSLDSPAEGEEPARWHIARDLAHELEIDGPVATLSAACISGTAALATAAGWLEDSRCDAVLVAGVDALGSMVHSGFSGLGVLSSSPPTPLAAERSGLALGEGAGCLLLERSAQGHSVWLRGVGLANDALHATAPDREGRGAAAAMRAAMLDADLAPEQIHALSLHATGTRFNDAMEAHALRLLFGDSAPPIHICKQVTGHTLGASGAIEAALLAQVIDDGQLPAQPSELDPALPWPTARPAAAPRNGLTTSSAFGGMNAAAVLADAPGTPRAAISIHTSEPQSVQLEAGPHRWSELWPDAPSRVLRTHRFVRVALLALHRLMQAEGTAPEGAGVVVAGPWGCRSVDHRYFSRVLREGPANGSRVEFAASVCTAPAAEAAILWGLTGPTLGFVGHHTQAIVEAASLVRGGRAPAMFALQLDCASQEGPATCHATLVRALHA